MQLGFLRGEISPVTGSLADSGESGFTMGQLGFLEPPVSSKETVRKQHDPDKFVIRADFERFLG